MDWRDAARQLTDRLTASGELSDQAWRTAFADTPRHEFVPGFSPEEAYDDQALVTQRRPAAVPGGDLVQLPTSSASQPGVMAVMLERLEVAPGMRVLEIGTGSGYNAALLCHRLGHANVYSVDLDPQLVAQADRVLVGLGYRSHLRVADGADGWPEEGPFHRIIATCAIDHIPPAWIDQLVPGGRIVAPLLGDECALMVLDKTTDDEVTGRFDNYRTAFMPMRPDVGNPLAAGRTFGLATHGIGQHGTTDLDPAAFDHTDTDLILLLHLHLPGLSIGRSEGPDGKFLTLSTPAGAAQVARVAEGRDGRFTTIQHHTRLWDTAEHVAGLWERLGGPDRGRYGISALNRTDRQYVWLDHPDSRHAWSLPL